MNLRIVIFAKVPLPGLAKTRLMPALGAKGSAKLAHRMLLHTVDEAIEADIGPVELCVTPDPFDPAWTSLSAAFDSHTLHWQAQGNGDLGERLARACCRVTSAGEAVLLIGTDCPALNPRHLREAATALKNHDAVMIPSNDGGYVLLGLSYFHASVFHNIAWSTDSVAASTCHNIARLRWSLKQLPALNDIDQPDDLRFLPPDWSPYDKLTTGQNKTTRSQV